MPPRKSSRKLATRKSKPPRVGKGRSRRLHRVKEPGHFVGRAGSPVLDKYPPKAMDAAVSGVAITRPAVAVVPPTPAPVAPATPAVPIPVVPTSTPSNLSTSPRVLISLEKPFDIDDFSQLLGQTQIQVTVPSESVSEVLRRAYDFMGFGIYVYSIRVRPGPEELLKTFVIELQRVDYSAQAKDWVPFQDRGRADSPFGPTGTR